MIQWIKRLLKGPGLRQARRQEEEQRRKRLQGEPLTWELVGRLREQVSCWRVEYAKLQQKQTVSLAQLNLLHEELNRAQDQIEEYKEILRPLVRTVQSWDPDRTARPEDDLFIGAFDAYRCLNATGKGPLAEQIERLGRVILRHYPEEVQEGRFSGTIDLAIELLLTQATPRKDGQP